MFGLKKTYTGVDISRKGVVVARVTASKERWKVLNFKKVPFPSGTVGCTFRSANIKNREAFQNALKEALGPKAGRVGLSLPNEIVKVSIQRFDELPDSSAEIRRMLAWSMEKTLHLPSDSLRISHHRLDRGKGGNLLVAMGIYDVVREYEEALRDAGGQARVVRPAGVNQFNFFSRSIDPTETVAFVGLFENFFTFYVLDGGRMIFYQEIKKEFLNESLFENMDMTIQYYMSDNSRQKIRRIFMGSRADCDLSDLGRRLAAVSGVELSLIDESKAAEWKRGVPEGCGGALISAVGAAQSLGQEG